MSRLLAAAIATVMGATPASALPVLSFESDTNIFQDTCTDCEIAVAQGRSGNNDTNNPLSGDWEINLAADGNAGDNRQFDWTDTPTAFSLTKTGTNLVFDIGGFKDSETFELSGLRSIAIRARGETDGAVKLTDLSFATHVLPDIDTTGATGNVSWIWFNVADSSADWTLSGNALLGNGTGRTSNQAFQIKLTDIGVVPLPAGMWLLLSGVGGLGLLRRIKARAAA